MYLAEVHSYDLAELVFMFTFDPLLKQACK